ncbi:histone acetyltransferase subunit NuA4-domain-containing protein [Dendryphion nanum]|uniref:Chromatin modification-related protein EAF6 n=1 Tax=Dendryphion nanum TaxID=256645 RepID=A0A9P9IKN5_9PLEO|nr:histone acetyltransferase subunit NuA4-domain-containing protein [Dendryphion nanum]
MAENAPPTSATNAAADTSRGMPYYERLRRDLRESLQRKRTLDTGLAQIEDNILRIETAYLEETNAGNIIKGFDNYIKGATAGTTSSGAGTATRRKVPISDADRIFSRSSSSFMKVRVLSRTSFETESITLGEIISTDKFSQQDSSAPNSATTTPSHAQTPTSSFATRENSQPSTNGGNKNGVANKKKKAPDDDEADTKPAKRGKITYGRD